MKSSGIVARRLWLTLVTLCIACPALHGRVFNNVDKVGSAELEEAGKGASATFLKGGVSFWQMMVHVEHEDFEEATSLGEQAIKDFKSASAQFESLSKLIDEDVTQKVKAVDLAQAGKRVYVTSDHWHAGPVTKYLEDGDVSELFMFCANRIDRLSARLEEFLQGLSDKRGIEEPIDQVLRELVHEWNHLIIQGQYVSSTFDLAGRSGR